MSVIEIYRTFMHREPDKKFTVKVPYSTKAPRELAFLGKLRELKGEIEGYEARWPWASKSGALLLTSGTGTLYCFDPTYSLQAVPRLTDIAYECDKGKGLAVYVHKFKPAVKLSVVAGSRGCLGRITGRYRIESDGIV